MSGKERRRLEYRYANVIIDISHESVDRMFQYRIPEALKGRIQAGDPVYIPFGAGKRPRRGYVVELTNELQYDAEKLKELSGLVEGGVSAQAQLIWLAWWMKERYGSTMNQALHTVLPVRKEVKHVRRRRIRCLLSPEALSEAIQEAKRRGYKARLRLLSELARQPVLPYEEAMGRLKLTAAVLKPLLEQGSIAVEEERQYRDPLEEMKRLSQGTDLCRQPVPELNEAQRRTAEGITGAWAAGDVRPSLIHGVTGSGKTEIYMELIAWTLGQGRQAIVLIPEISLTWQTVMRFFQRFEGRVSVLHSRMSQGERYDQYERALKGEIDIMIGPRSALFAPFSRLGVIIIDEEHENSYKSELSPRYDARETAAARAERSGAGLVLGSATPSLASYYRAERGEFHLYTLSERAKKEAALPSVEVIDLRRELAEGNRSIFSRRLKELLEDRLKRKEQAMLFLNRRGYASFISCRSCGEALKCPHCDVSLTLHRDGRLHCHYCGYQIRRPERCPSCGSPYIAPFGTGTQKIEELAAREFPGARILRMDLDTTSKKGGHQELLATFARGEADLLIGTQMIVKGHDFPRVTLVGALAADLSLYASDYRCAEETFDLLTQAAGRAGRGSHAGTMVIQTYQPDHYSIQAAARQDYRLFYRQEMNYRRLLGYPPAVGLLAVRLFSPSEEELARAQQALNAWSQTLLQSGSPLAEGLQAIGPVNAPIYKVNDIYRKILYIKHENCDILIQIRKMAEQCLRRTGGLDSLTVQYDMSE